LPLGAELGSSGSVGVAAGMSASDSRRAAAPQREPRPRARTSDPGTAHTQEGDEGTDTSGRDGGQVIALPPRDSLAPLGDHERERQGRRNPPDEEPAPVAFLHRPRMRNEDSPEGSDQ